MPYSAPGPFLGAQTAAAYQVSRSLRFRSSASAYLSRTFGTPTSTKKCTFSFWMKLGKLSPAAYAAVLSYNNASILGQIGIYLTPSDELLFVARPNGSTSLDFYLLTNMLFRDISSWYHVVIAIDTTQASYTDGYKLWVNGTRVTSFSSSPTAITYTQNSNLNFTNGLNYQIGTELVNSRYFDGYLAEVNFIDGQQLTPSSFGQSNALTGVWEPKAYVPTGTGYGTNGFYLPFTLNSTSTYAGSFNGSSQSLSTPSTTVMNFGSSNYTIETWIKTTQTTQYATVISKTPSAFSTGMWTILLNNTVSGDVAVYMHEYNVGTTHMLLSTGVTVNDGNWHHLALVRNGSAHTLYVDGISRASVTSSFTISNLTAATYIGQDQYYTRYFNGQLSNVRIVNGTAVYTAPFTPPSAALTAITNTQLLTLQNATIVDNSTNAFTLTNTGTVTTASATPFVANVTSDASGQNNGWTSNNINYTSSGTTYDSMLDVPTNYADGGNGRGNYATLNPNGKLYTNAVSTVSNGNLTATGSGTILQGTMATSTSGKYYFEMTATTVSGTDDWVGFILASATGSSGVSGTSLLFRSNGQKFTSSAWAAYGSSWTSGNVIGCAIDLDNGAIYFAINNTWQTSGDPTSGSAKTGAAFTNATMQISGVSYGIIQSLGTGSGQQDFNFGQRPFTYTPPSGYSALNTQNLPAPALTPSP